MKVCLGQSSATREKLFASRHTACAFNVSADEYDNASSVVIKLIF